MEDRATQHFDLDAHVFERELQERPPRPLPAFVGESKYDRSQSRAIKAWVLAGGCLYALAALPFVKSLSYNILPLGYLHYIGPACAAVGLLGLAAKALRLGRYMEFEYDIGAAEIHRGYFGWPWVKRVWPVRPVEKPGEEGGYEFEIVGIEKNPVEE